jgi:hypothetical protein
MALRINPTHGGVSEYLAGLHLETGKQDRDEERLAVLRSACPWDCEEHEDVKGAVEKYKAEKK